MLSKERLGRDSPGPAGKYKLPEKKILGTKFEMGPRPSYFNFALPYNEIRPEPAQYNIPTSTLHGKNFWSKAPRIRDIPKLVKDTRYKEKRHFLHALY